MNYSLKIDYWKIFDKNNPIFALNILYIKEEEICQAYISKINLNCYKKIIFLMIPNKEKEGYLYLAVKNVSDITYRNNLKT